MSYTTWWLFLLFYFSLYYCLMFIVKCAWALERRYINKTYYYCIIIIMTKSKILPRLVGLFQLPFKEKCSTEVCFRRFLKPYERFVWGTAARMHWKKILCSNIKIKYSHLLHILVVKGVINCILLLFCTVFQCPLIMLSWFLCQKTS